MEIKLIDERHYSIKILSLSSSRAMATSFPGSYNTATWCLEIRNFNNYTAEDMYEFFKDYNVAHVYMTPIYVITYAEVRFWSKGEAEAALHASQGTFEASRSTYGADRRYWRPPLSPILK
ncbi:hypothetical protein C5167_046797 [Papaver somniferum]|uniref:RRM domain-containing protein n=1 Tax=Papaver somniferum TaxID=3469 RepID=A0A4Y7LH87_PAPSO|nr:hypothetical protein C5167_046797 [Papaver somniferum]